MTHSVANQLEAILKRLEERHNDEKVFTTIYADSARKEAKAADKRREKGQSLGPLDGVIISIKDLFDVEGEPTLAGSVIHKSSPAAQQDALAVQRLRKAGAVIIGKTNMTEFAFTAIGLNPHFGVPGNALDASKIPGGSSSGAAVSVGEGTSQIAIGSDTGGSIRIPAALNGLVGFKPTSSRIAMNGVFPLAPTLDSIGPIAHSVSECFVTDAVLADEDTTLPAKLSLNGLKLAMPNGYLMSATQSSILEAFMHSSHLCEQQGANIQTIEIDDLIEELSNATKLGSIAGIEASHLHSDWLDDANANVDHRVKTTLTKRRTVSETDYQNILKIRTKLAKQMDERLKEFDFLIMPTTPIHAVSIVSVNDNEHEYNRVESLLLRNTQIANQFDLCAISLPIKTNDMPAGFMLCGRHGDDKRLLAAALSLEAIFAK